MEFTGGTRFVCLKRNSTQKKYINRETIRKNGKHISLLLNPGLSNTKSIHRYFVKKPDSVGVFRFEFLSAVGLSGSLAIKHKSAFLWIYKKRYKLSGVALSHDLGVI